MAEDEGGVFYLVWGLGGEAKKYFERKNRNRKFFRNILKLIVWHGQVVIQR